MLGIKRSEIEKVTKTLDSKTIKFTNNDLVRKGFRISIFNFIDKLDELSIYEMGHTINFIDRWLHNRTSNNIKTSKRGDIVFVDLGATNFRFEPSFTHPAIVLKNSYNSILIVPCSTKKYGKGLECIIDATPKDGFSKNTGIQTDALRWINKNRVISYTGKRTSGEILDKINKKILEYVPTYKRDKHIFEITKKKNEDLEKENKDLKKENEDLKLKLEKLIKEINNKK